MGETKLVRIYVLDWTTINDYIFSEQAKRKNRLSFADVIHELVEKVILVEGGEKPDNSP